MNGEVSLKATTGVRPRARAQGTERCMVACGGAVETGEGYRDAGRMIELAARSLAAEQRHPDLGR